VLDVLTPPHPLGSADGKSLSVRIYADRVGHVIWVGGELDVTTRGFMLESCVQVGHGAVVVEMAGLTFMDCAGYGALVTGRRVLERRGGSLSLVHAAGEPLRLLALIDAER
jgi:anti-anti-sigma factor